VGIFWDLKDFPNLHLFFWDFLEGGRISQTLWSGPHSEIHQNRSGGRNQEFGVWKRLELELRIHEHSRKYLFTCFEKTICKMSDKSTPNQIPCSSQRSYMEVS
jgi:hypothetical protein